MNRFDFRLPGRAIVLGILAAALVVPVATAASPGKTGPTEPGREIAPGVCEARLVFPGANGAPVHKTAAAVRPAATVSADPKSIAGAQAWSTLLDDGFDSGFPGTAWTVTYDGTEAYWGDWSCWGVSSSQSVGCAAAGTSAISCGSAYPNGMNTWMTSGPYDLSDPGIMAGVLECYLNLQCEPNNGATYYDYFFFGVSLDGSSFSGYKYADTVLQTVSIDLQSVPTEGDILGESQVWVALAFSSDSSVNEANGAQVDDVVLAVDVPQNEAPVVTLVYPNGGETLTIGYSESVQISAADPDGGPGDLEVSLDYSTDGGATWVLIQEGLPYQTAYDWTVPDSPTTQGKLRVRVWDGAAAASDSSASDFAIVANELPTVELLAPNGGEVLEANATTTVSYTAGDPDSGPRGLQIGLEYSLDDGDSWYPIESGLPNTGSVQWTTPDVTTTRARMRITAWDGSAEVPDVSDATFTIAETISLLDLGDGSGDSGTTVTLDLSLENEIPVGGLQADLVFDGAQAFLSGIGTTGRAASAVGEAEQTGENQARILIYFDTDSQLAAGTGTIANLEFTLQGPGGGSTPVQLQDVILADPDGNGLGVESSDGVLTIGTPAEAPVLQISALKNPARPRSMQILVQVDNGSGNAPNVTAGGTPLSLTSLGQAVYLATYSAASSATEVTIIATDSNIRGIGTSRITVEYP